MKTRSGSPCVRSGLREGEIIGSPPVREGLTDVTMYTDGCCLKNPGGFGGHAAVVLVEGQWERVVSGGTRCSTNNREEMLAVIVGLESLSGPSSVVVYSDSKLVINCGLKKWRRRTNLDLWERFDAARAGHHLRWCWVRGHNGDRHNELADRTARQAAVAQRRR